MVNIKMDRLSTDKKKTENVYQINLDNIVTDKRKWTMNWMQGEVKKTS